MSALAPRLDTCLAAAPGQHAEERLDIRVRADVAVTVEVGRAARRATVPGETREEGFDVRIRADVPVPVEVRGVDGEHRGVRGGAPARVGDEAPDLVAVHARARLDPDLDAGGVGGRGLGGAAARER